VQEQKPEVNLVFGGCGSALACLAGAYRHWSTKYKVRGKIGTSGGAIIALLIAMGWSGKAIEYYILNSPFAALLDNPGSGWRHFGWYSGKKLQKRIHELCPLTFKELGDPSFIVVAGNYTKHRAEYYSLATSPDMQVSEAIRRSISIPLLFSYVTDAQSKEIFVDGGMYNNFAIDFWTQDTAPTHGFRVIGAHNRPMRFTISSNPLSFFKNLGIYMLNLLNGLMALSETSHISHDLWGSVCTINTKTNGLVIKQSTEDVMRMFDEGAKASEAFCKNQS
jgi:NTE family protein